MRRPNLLQPPDHRRDDEADDGDERSVVSSFSHENRSRGSGFQRRVLLTYNKRLFVCRYLVAPASLVIVGRKHPREESIMADNRERPSAFCYYLRCGKRGEGSTVRKAPARGIASARNKIAVMESPVLEGANVELRSVSGAGAKRRNVLEKLNVDYGNDILYEIMKRMDVKSLARAACVSTTWKKISGEEILWEKVCIQHFPNAASHLSQMRTVVVPLGGFRNFYVHYLLPMTTRWLRTPRHGGVPGWTPEEMSLLLSLFSVECYERLPRRHLPPSTLRILCEASTSHFFTALAAMDSNIREKEV